MRCDACHRKLAEGLAIRLTIKCPRCGAINHFSTTERPRAPSQGHTDGCESGHPLAGRQAPSG
nr:Com family DNA-binding transcriptional regulator [Vogesella mureinivorans]